MKTRLRPMIPTYSRFPLFLALVWNCLAYYGGRLIAGNLYHFSFVSVWDQAIPQLPWTISIYFISYFFWAVNYILAARRDEADAYRFFCADFLTKLVCFLCFIFLPATMERPAVSGNDLWSGLLRFLYRVDAADNLFPSIHCAASVLSVLGIMGDKRIPAWYRGTSWLFAAAVCVSTLTTKQHVLVDAIDGVVLALAAYRIAGISKVSELYRKMIKRCT